MLDPEDDSFAATLILEGQHSPSSTSPPDLVSLDPSTQTIDRMASTRSTRDVKAAAAAATAATSMDGDDEQDPEAGDEAYEDDEQGRGQAQRMQALNAEDLTQEDDDAAHDKQTRAAAASGKKRKTPARVGKWGPAEDLQLCSSVLAWVNGHKGQLPSASRTGQKAQAPDAWKEIAQGVPHVAKLADANAGGRA